MHIQKRLQDSDVQGLREEETIQLFKALARLNAKAATTIETHLRNLNRLVAWPEAKGLIAREMHEALLATCIQAESKNKKDSPSVPHEDLEVRTSALVLLLEFG